MVIHASTQNLISLYIPMGIFLRILVLVIRSPAKWAEFSGFHGKTI
jgi:hypothetical protein